MNMKWSFAVFLLFAHACQGAVLHKSERTDNTYENLQENGLDYGKVEENEISDERDSLYGLYPPKITAKDYYVSSKRSYPEKGTPTNGEYVIDTVNRVVKLNTEEGSRETKLKAVEEVEIKKLSAAFAKLFENSKLESYDWESPTQTEPPVTETPLETSTEDWRKLSPIITVSKSGVSISFGNETSTEAETNTETDTEDDTSRDSLWDDISKSVDKILVGELNRRLNMTEDETTITSTEEAPAKEEVEDSSALGRFVSSVWNMLKTSLDYVGAFFSNLMTSDKTAAGNTTDVPETTVAEEEEETVTALPTTTAAVFAYEEPTRYKRLPAEEFETRRRDIDSIFYGYGIV